MPLDVARRGTLDVRDPPLKAIVAANDNYEAGYHKGNAGGLDAVDTDLATANIKNGITIFGKVGSADVHDISDATAVEAEVLDPETFYAVSGGIRTGTMPTVAIALGSSAYPAGYHAGDVGGLPAIDADLATGNIKSGITIFNVAGHNDVRDISDADLVEAEAPTGKFFYAVSGGRRTGSGTKTLSDANDTVAAGYYAATTLSAVDAHLAAANILSGITIFGFTGPATVQDIADADAVLANVLAGKTFYSVTGGRKTGNMPAVAIVADNNAYPAGLHAGDGGGLSAIDVNLAAANIRSGVNIFGSVGVATVQEIGAADAVLADVKNGKTFFSVTGGIKTGNLATVALAAGSNAYPAGYHAGDVGGLDAVDLDLVTANIKNGITIFNVAGSVDVRDVSDANALVGEVKTGSTFYAVGGARKTGNGTQTLNPANENVVAGYYAGTTLSAVDAQLAAANILSGVNIFGFVGVATVQDIADANALVGEVLNPRTFYSVTGARKTGTMATVALAPGSNAYPAGYHVGAANLTAVDGDLVTANIKNGITIFNIAGDVDVRDVSDADALVGEVKTGSTFYAVGGARKTGNGTQTLNPANEIVQDGYYAATTLSAVDGDLAVGNIAAGVTIFGFLGTYSPALIDDIIGSAETALLSNDTCVWERHRSDVGAAGDLTIATKTQAYAAGSRAFAAGFVSCCCDEDEEFKLRLFMAGVQVVETAYVAAGQIVTNYILTFIKAMAGSQECKLTAHNYDTGEERIYIPGGEDYQNTHGAAAIAIGSIKT